MDMIKHIIVILLISVLTAEVSVFGSSDAVKYERAQSLMAEEEYADAAKIFDELSSYEESAKLVVLMASYPELVLVEQ